MVRVYNHGGVERLMGSSGGAVLVLWAALISVALIWAIIFSCADGASKDKASATHDTYGSTCGGCGAACGG
ncbi:hypothetical protein FNV43_RR26661 [Rhamnella rubrinervis]|uniref:Uncharacterized protein n=1 Tax=Rhamnella rubrinervis TaxID=2594499 RepID=A0A8K0DQA4_9ROSA|nr:hypothetical protein FNV43_RR26661 [Rhamnella rubrinervis]